MDYQVSSLNDAGTVDSIISQTVLERSSMQIKMAGIQTDLSTYSTTSDDIPSAIAYVSAEIENAEENLPNLPEGDFRTKMETALLRNKLKLNLLEKKAEEYSAFAQLDRQFEVAKLTGQIDESDQYLAQLTLRRDELLANPPASDS